MKRLLVLLAACGGSGGGSDAPPPKLPFHQVTVPLQPAGAPQWTLSLPQKWSLDRHLVGQIDGRELLVNGAGEPVDDEVAAASYEDPDADDGHFDFLIGNPGDHARADRLIDATRHRGDVLDDHGSADDHVVAAKADNGRIWILHLWWPAGVDQFRACSVVVGKEWADWWRAFEASCAHVVEQ